MPGRAVLQRLASVALCSALHILTACTLICKKCRRSPQTLLSPPAFQWPWQNLSQVDPPSPSINSFAAACQDRDLTFHTHENPPALTLANSLNLLAPSSRTSCSRPPVTKRGPGQTSSLHRCCPHPHTRVCCEFLGNKPTFLSLNATGLAQKL